MTLPRRCPTRSRSYLLVTGAQTGELEKAKKVWEDRGWDAERSAG